MLTEIPRRHTLLRLSRAGEESLWLRRETVYPDPAAWEAVWERFRGIPVITRRRAAPGELIPVGVSLPIRRDGGRWRMASQVPLDGVTQAISAVQAAEMCAEGSLPFSRLMAHLLRQAPRYGAAAGLFGSAPKRTQISRIWAVCCAGWRNNGACAETRRWPWAAGDMENWRSCCPTLALSWSKAVQPLFCVLPALSWHPWAAAVNQF